jgi:hypothetical protein
MKATGIQQKTTILPVTHRKKHAASRVYNPNIIQNRQPNPFGFGNTARNDA